MSGIKEIKSKIKSVSNIRKITKAMEMISRSKMKKTTDKALNARAYALYAWELLTNLSYDEFNLNPLLSFGKGEKILIVPITSNKGLCGGYNSSILREIKRAIKLNEGRIIESLPVGKYAVKYSRICGLKIIKSIIDFDENINISNAERLSKEISDIYLQGEFRNVLIIYTNYVSIIKQSPRTKPLLPVTAENISYMISHTGEEGAPDTVMPKKKEENLAQYILEPNQETILDTVVPKLVIIQTLQALLEASASEQAARMMAMKNATENADSFVSRLQLSFNRARQDTVTREISEIAAGADALS